MRQELFLCEKKNALSLKNKQVVFLYVYLINLNRIDQIGLTPEPLYGHVILVSGYVVLTAVN